MFALAPTLAMTRTMGCRSDCRDGHPEFTARKSIQFVINELRYLPPPPIPPCPPPPCNCIITLTSDLCTWSIHWSIRVKTSTMLANSLRKPVVRAGGTRGWIGPRWRRPSCSTMTGRRSIRLSSLASSRCAKRFGKLHEWGERERRGGRER